MERNLETFFKEVESLGFAVRNAEIYLDNEWFARIKLVVRDEEIRLNARWRGWFNGIETDKNRQKHGLDGILLEVVCDEPDNRPLVKLAEEYGMRVHKINLIGEPELGTGYF